MVVILYLFGMKKVNGLLNKKCSFLGVKDFCFELADTSQHIFTSSKVKELTSCPKIKFTPVLSNELSNDSLKDCIDFLRFQRPCGCWHIWRPVDPYNAAVLKTSSWE